MFAILHALGTLVVDLFKSRSRLGAENLFLRHQLTIALRRAPPRRRLRGSDRALLTWMTRLWPSLLGMAQVVQPETILRWHRAGIKAFRRWKSPNRAGRPKIDRGLRDLIQRMSRENPLWGASRIHGELLMLGFEVAQSTVSKYIVRRQNPPSQSWKTFLRNHAGAIAAIDMCVVPTITFDLLFAFLVLGHGRRQLLWFEVTRHPTAEWLARQITEAFPWRSAPTYLVRDNDRAYGHVFTRRLRAMGIRDRPISRAVARLHHNTNRIFRAAQVGVAQPSMLCTIAERETTDRYQLGAGAPSSAPLRLRLKCQIASSLRRKQKRTASPVGDTLVGFQTRPQTAGCRRNIDRAFCVMAVAIPAGMRREQYRSRWPIPIAAPEANSQSSQNRR